MSLAMESPAMPVEMMGAAHPLEPLAPSEITRAVAIIRAAPQCSPGARFACVQLHEPDKNVALNYNGGDWNRQAFASIMADGQTIEIVVSLSDESIESWEVIPNAQPPLLLDEFFECENTVKAYAPFIEACAKRGVFDMDLVMVDPWSAGAYGDEEGAGTEGKRLARAMAWVRESPNDNGYARPLEGVAIYVDLAKNEVVKFLDYGVTALPPQPGNWAREFFDGREGELQAPLKPLEIVQPDGPTFEVNGHEVTWANWKVRLDFWAREGLVLRDCSFDGRPIFYRASMCDMVVPYGDPDPFHAHKNAFDVGEYGLGMLANALELGCDCLGLIRYFDGFLVNTLGEVVKLPNAICMHEEDFGVLWKHTDWRNGQNETRRSRRLVISFWCTVGNYEYGFFWYFYLDGNIEFEIKLSGIINTGAKPEGYSSPYGEMVAPGLYAPIHQHFFNVRMDMSVDGTNNTVSEVHTERAPLDENNPYKNGFFAQSTPIKSEKEALEVGLVDTLAARYWKITNPNVKNAMGKPTGYKLMPGENVAFMPDRESSVGQRAGFCFNHLWVTPYDPTQLYASGPYPNQHTGGAGLPAYVADDKPTENTDVVVWYSFGAHHVVRAEDWPVMPTAYIGFMLKPVGFFDRNPAINLPPDEVKHSQQVRSDGSISGDLNGFAAPPSCCGS